MSGKDKVETKEKFANQEYPIHLVGRHMEITDAIRSYAVEKLSKINHFGGRIMEATISMDVQKIVHKVDFIINVNNTKIKVSGVSDNMYASIDLAIDRLKNKLSRYLKRLHEHHARGAAAIEMNVNLINRVVDEMEIVNDEIEEASLQKVDLDLRPHPVVSSKTILIKTLNNQEAVMKIELSEDAFLVYRSEEDQKLKVIYRRDDGNYGIIECEK